MQMYDFFAIITTFAAYFAFRSPCTFAFAQVRRRLGNAKMKVAGLSFCISLALHFRFAQVRRRLGNTKLKVAGLSFCISLALH